MCNYWSQRFNDSMWRAPVTGKVIEYLRVACTIAGKRDEREHCKYQCSHGISGMCRPASDVMSDAISFVWLAGTFPEHLKVQYEL